MCCTCLILALFLGTSGMLAQEALVDGNWLKHHLLDEERYILDIQTPEHYRRGQRTL